MSLPEVTQVQSVSLHDMESPTTDLEYNDPEYDRFMANLSPCSSILTVCSSQYTPMEYNPINLVNMLNKRNSLSKSGTLTDDRNTPISKFEMEDSDSLIKILCPDGDSFTIPLQELLLFVNKYASHACGLEDLSVLHLLIFLSQKYSVRVNSLKLCHLGRTYCLKSPAEINLKKWLLLQHLKIKQYPTMHLTNVLSATSVFDNYVVQDLILKTFEEEFYAVTYVDAIAHKLKKAKKVRFRGKLRRMLHV